MSEREPTLDVARLLQPASEGSPSGVDPRDHAELSAKFYEIKSRREAARERERRADVSATQAPLSEEWRDLLKAVPRLIEEESKDFSLAAWLTEGLVRKHGFAGLADGLRLLHGLADVYWESAYPALEDGDGGEARLSAVRALDNGNGTLKQPLKDVPLTSSDRGTFTLAHYEMAFRASADAEFAEACRQQKMPALEDIQAAFDDTSTEHLTIVYSAADESRELLDQLASRLAELCVGDADMPRVFDTLKGVLSDVHAVIERFAKHRLDVVVEDSDDDVAKESAEAALPTSRGGAIDTRHEALRQLGLVAGYFRSTEPHSPLSYALDQAVRWGAMSLPELMAELIQDSTARADFFRLVGIPQDESTS